jgi:FkbM family methyltransferase
MNNEIIRIVSSEEVKPILKTGLTGELTVDYNGIYKITSNDPASLYTELKDIFEKKIYHFDAKGKDKPFVIDGGGHIGVSVLYFKMIYPHARILVFEPDPTSLKYLKLNVIQNNITDVTIVEKGLFSEERKIRFVSDGSDGGKISPHSGNTEIAVTALSKYIEEPVDFLKLNIEGAELAVFKEVSPRLKKVEQLVFEFHSFPEFHQNLHEILEILHINGFRYVINHFDQEVNPRAVPPFNINERSKYFQLVYAVRVLKKQGEPRIEKPIPGPKREMEEEGIALYRKASLKKQQFNLPEAERLFRLILNDAEENPTLKGGANFHLACMARLQGRENEAKEYFEKCLSYIPDHRKALLYLERRESFAGLQGLSPVSPCYGADRGTPIDRYYIEHFLHSSKEIIRGRVLELLNDRYSRLFGEDRVEDVDVLDIDTANKKASAYGDLRNTSMFPSNRYDCIILTQTIHIIDDFHSVLTSVHRMLKKGGILLVTLPSVSRIDVAAGIGSDFWRFTTASAEYMFKKHFKTENLEIIAHGNVWVCAAFLYGLALEELTREELDYQDENFPLMICVKAIK